MALRKPDSTVGGGLMSLLSPLYPRKPVDVGESAFQTMPEDRWRFQAAACCSLLR